MRQQPEQYKKVLEEHERIYKQYGRHKDQKGIEERFEIWKTWTLEHKITPSQQSKDKEEKKIGVMISNMLYQIRKQPEQYKAILEEYEKIYKQYGRHKDQKGIEERFALWKSWTLEHKITPSQYSENKKEIKIAKDISNSLQQMKKEPEKYKEILEEYTRIYKQYGREKDFKGREENFEVWKRWTLEHKITPSQHTKKEEERKVAKAMTSSLCRMEKEPEKYKEILEEYTRIYKQYGRRKDQKGIEERFEIWKSWTIEHRITPSEHSKNEEERKIGAMINNMLHQMKKHPEQYKEILKEYEKLYSKYGRRKLKSLQQKREQELSNVKTLKEQAEQAETLDNETREAVQKEINSKSKKPEGPGE